MTQTLIEKIAQRFAVNLEPGHEVHAGDYLSISPAHCMTHDNSGAVIPKFKSIGARKIANPRQVVFTLDHNVQDKGEANLAKYRMIEEFAGEMGIDFYPAGRGIGHQIMCEEGYVWPCTMVVASDSHSNMYGGLGCLGTPIVRTDAAAIWATGRTWWQVPPVAQVVLRGSLRRGATGKDVIITLCGLFNNDEVLNHVVEFVGEGVSNLSVDERLTIANMTTEWGALAGVFPTDDITIGWLQDRAAGKKDDHPRLNKSRLAELLNNKLSADKEAVYATTLTLDLNSVSPFVSGPDHVKIMTSIAEMSAKKIKIDKAYLVSCVNSRLEDLALAAKTVMGRKVAEGVEFYIAAASSEVQTESERRGDWQRLIDCGAKPLPPGCGPCIGLGIGLLEDGQVGISATNRNFKGRMGSRNAEAYLGSPEVVAASAIAGYITLPGWEDVSKPIGECIVNTEKTEDTAPVKILDGFPSEITGRLIFCHRDNLNTDGIYPGKYTYVDDFSAEQQASVVMENYDPEFGKVVADGDILAGGFNFGTGSSREQAATALKHRGIRLILAGSFSATYQRNALNNGFMAIEAPKLINDLKKRFGEDDLTVVTNMEVRVDFAASQVIFDNKKYEISPLGAAAQELVVVGGLENWVKARL